MPASFRVAAVPLDFRLAWFCETTSSRRPAWASVPFHFLCIVSIPGLCPEANPDACNNALRALPRDLIGGCGTCQCCGTAITPHHYPSERQLIKVSGKDGLPLFLPVLELHPLEQTGVEKPPASEAFRIVQPNGAVDLGIRRSPTWRSRRVYRRVEGPPRGP